MKMKRTALLSCVVLVLAITFGAVAANAPADRRAIVKKAALNAKIDERLAKAKADYAKALAAICEKVIAREMFGRAKEIIGMVEPLDKDLAAELTEKIAIAKDPIIGTWRVGPYILKCMPDQKIHWKRSGEQGFRGKLGRWVRNGNGKYGVDIFPAAKFELTPAGQVCVGRWILPPRKAVVRGTRIEPAGAKKKR